MTSILLPARSLVVETRLPKKVAPHSGDPFTTPGDAVVDCNVVGCGWHVYGPRSEMKKALQAHYREWHASRQDIGIFLINDPRRTL